MRLNLTNILKAKDDAGKAAGSQWGDLNGTKLDIVQKWHTAGILANTVRKACMMALAEAVLNAYGKVEDWSFSKSAGAYFKDFVTPEAKSFAKMDALEQRRFSQSWSEHVAVPKAGGKTPAEKAKGKRSAEKASKTKPVTYEQCEAAVDTFTAKEKLALVKALSKSLGLSIPASLLKVG